MLMCFLGTARWGRQAFRDSLVRLAAVQWIKYTLAACTLGERGHEGYLEIQGLTPASCVRAVEAPQSLVQR